MTSTMNNDDGAATPPRNAAAAATPAAGHPAQPGMVAFAGIGPGGPELLTVRAAYLIGRADLVAGQPEVVDGVRDLIPAGAEVRDLADLDAEPELLAAAAQAGRLAVALYGGDPLLFGPAAGHVATCARAGARFEIVPGVPAATAVPAYAGIPLTSEAGGDVRIVHAADVSRVSGDGPPPRTLVILGAEAGPPDLAKMLTAAGLAGLHPLRHHLERRHHRPAHGDLRAGVGDGRHQGGRRQPADRDGPGRGGGRRGRRRAPGAVLV